MSFDQQAIFGLIVITLLLFVWGRWRYDVVALIALIGSVFLGLVDSNDIFSGFGHPATVTVAIVLILSYGLTKSGAVEGIATLVAPISHRPTLHIAALTFVAAFLSMFMNNVGALALLMPVALQSTKLAGRSPSLVLMPLSFGSILGGLVTLIGTPPNIIISTYRDEIMGEPFSMFDFAPVGGAVAIIGTLFMVIVGWRLVKIRKNSVDDEMFEIDSYLFEVKISEESSAVGQTIRQLEEQLFEMDITIVTLVHKKHKYAVPRKRHELQASDVLILEGSHDDINRFVSKSGVMMLGAENARDEVLHSKDTVAMEVVLAPGSDIDGKTVEQIRFRYKHHVNLLAVSRQGHAHRDRLRSMKLHAGDVLLIHGDTEDVSEAMTRLGCYPLANRDLGFGKHKYALPALLIFGCAVALSGFGLFPIQVSLGAAVLGMVLYNIIPVKELYDGIDWPVVVLLGAMIPVGSALEGTGATRLIADSIILYAPEVSPVMLLAIVLIVTMTLSDILNNAATAILMAPIARDIALSFQVNVDAFLMAVAIGASCAFLTPIGHQNNALVMGPGGYRFGDYWRVGLPLEVLIVLTAIPMILLVWPL